MAEADTVIRFYIEASTRSAWIRDIDTQYWSGERTLFEGVDGYPAGTVVRLTNMRMIVAQRTGGFLNPHYAVITYGYEDMEYPSYRPRSKGDCSRVTAGYRYGQLMEFLLYSPSDAREVMRILGEQIHRLQPRVYEYRGRPS